MGIKISALPPQTTPDGADQLPTNDVSATTTKKMTLTVLKEWFQSLVGWITTAMIGDAQVTWSKIDFTTVQAAQQAWQTPTLQNGWVNYQNPVTNFPGAGYYKDSLGNVHVRGLIKSGTTSSNTLLFTLPAGYRPAYDLHIPIVSNSAAAGLIVKQDGIVQVLYGVSSNWVDLSSITFRAV